MQLQRERDAASRRAALARSKAAEGSTAGSTTRPSTPITEGYTLRQPTMNLAAFTPPYLAKLTLMIPAMIDMVAPSPNKFNSRVNP